MSARLEQLRQKQADSLNRAKDLRVLRDVERLRDFEEGQKKMLDEIKALRAANHLLTCQSFGSTNSRQRAPPMPSESFLFGSKDDLIASDTDGKERRKKPLSAETEEFVKRRGPNADRKEYMLMFGRAEEIRLTRVSAPLSRDPSSPTKKGGPPSPVKKPKEPLSLTKKKEPEPLAPVKNQKEPLSLTKKKEPEPLSPVKKPKEPLSLAKKKEPLSPVKPKEPLSPVKPEPLSLARKKEPLSPVKPKEPLSPVKPKEPLSPVKPKEPSSPVKPKEPLPPTKTKEPPSQIKKKEPPFPVKKKEPPSPFKMKEPLPNKRRGSSVKKDPSMSVPRSVLSKEESALSVLTTGTRERRPRRVSKAASEPLRSPRRISISSEREKYDQLKSKAERRDKKLVERNKGLAMTIESHKKTIKTLSARVTELSVETTNQVEWEEDKRDLIRCEKAIKEISVIITRHSKDALLRDMVLSKCDQYHKAIGWNTPKSLKAVAKPPSRTPELPPSRTPELVESSHGSYSDSSAMYSLI
jgi:hypothetical protein